MRPKFFHLLLLLRQCIWLLREFDMRVLGFQNLDLKAMGRCVPSAHCHADLALPVPTSHATERVGCRC